MIDIFIVINNMINYINSYQCNNKHGNLRRILLFLFVCLKIFLENK